MIQPLSQTLRSGKELQFLSPDFSCSAQEIWGQGPLQSGQLAQVGSCRAGLKSPDSPNSLLLPGAQKTSCMHK